MNDILNDLNSLKDQIQQAKQEKAEKTGQLSEQMKALKAFGVKTLVDGEKEVKKEEARAVKLEDKLTNGVKKLHKEYEW